MVNCWFGAFGGLDSERIPENERDWDSWVYPDWNPKSLGPKPTINHHHGNLRGSPQGHVYP